MKAKYPLSQLVTIKKRRLDEAEKKLKETKEILKKEKEKEKELIKARDKTYQHRTDKITQLRNELDSKARTDKIQQMKSYLKIVEEELKEREQKVKEQKTEVKKAEDQVEAARQNFIQKQYDLEKLKAHRKEWKKELKAIEQHREGVEVDELGTAMHTSKKYKH